MDLSVGSDDECGRMRNAVLPAGCFQIEDAELPDGIALRIGQHRETDLSLFGKALQRFLAVVTDRRDLNSGTLDLLQFALQLDQLPNAVRSPARRAMKDKCRKLLLFEQILQRDVFPVVSAQLERRRSVADFELLGFLIGRE